MLVFIHNPFIIYFIQTWYNIYKGIRLLKPLLLVLHKLFHPLSLVSLKLSHSCILFKSCSLCLFSYILFPFSYILFLFFYIPFLVFSFLTFYPNPGLFSFCPSQIVPSLTLYLNPVLFASPSSI